MKIREPRTLAQATSLLELHAGLSGQLASLEERRNRLIARANAAADAKAAPIVAMIEAIAERLEPWWAASAAAIGKGRKSVQLGGCIIGSRAGRPKLAHGFASDKEAVEALQTTRFSRQTLKVTYSLDRAATLKLLQLDGAAGKAIGKLGFSVDQAERFYIERAEQAGTIGA